MGLDTDQATGQPACSNYEFTASNHATCLLACMCDLRRDSTLCDITLCVAGEEFKAHRLVLAASSPYFSAMFTNQHLESSSSKVHLNGVDASALKLIIDFTYSSTLTISEENVQAVLAAANLLQITSVVDACCEFLEAQIDVDNCLGIAAFAELLSCSKLYRSSWRFALDNFHEVWKTEEFLSTPPSLLKELIKSESLHVMSEEEVLECVLLWYQHDMQGRVNHMKKLLHCIKLPLIPWSTLSDTLLSDPALSSDPECQLLLTNAKSYQYCPKMAEQFIDTPYYTKYLPRKSVGRSLFLYVVGGETTPGRSTVGSVERFNPSKSSWSMLAPMEMGRRGVGITFLNGLLYVLGGSDGIQALSLVERYDPHQNCWSQVCAMQQERSSVAATNVGNSIYAIGGYDGIMSCLKTVECYDPSSDTWTTLPADMNVARSMHGAATINSRIYVVGGYDGSADLASCEVYDPELNKWDMLMSMFSPRCMASVGVLGDKVYVVGGCDCSQSLSSVEVYSTDKKEWQVVADMNEPRSGHGVGVVGRKLYALGGYRGAALGYSSSIECYDVEANCWSLVGTMNGDRRRFGCCS